MRFLVALDVEPLERDQVARQEAFQNVYVSRPAVADQADTLERRHTAREPVIQQIVNDWIEVLFRRVEWSSRRSLMARMATLVTA